MTSHKHANTQFTLGSGSSWLAVLFVLSAVLLAGWGCQRAPERPKGRADVCDQNAGDIYDFRSDNCVKPQSSDQAYALSAYNVASRAAEQLSNSFLLYDVTFARPLTPDELSQLLADTRIASVAMLSLSFPTAGGAVFFSEPVPSSTPKSDAISSSIERGRAILVDNPDQSDLAATKDIDSAVANKSFTASSARLRLRAADVPAWWTDNIEVIKAAMLLDRTELVP